MPEIGATLREARMRARIDISEIEMETKIRAKYLRALENEEWDLLPGPTYVKSFLRTYAEALGLDAKLLVEEYKLRHERLPDHDLRPISPAGATARRGRTRPPRPLPRWLPIVAVLLALLVALYALGKLGGSGTPSGTPSSTPTPTSTQPPSSSATGTSSRAKRRRRAATAPAKPRVATLRLTATGQVYVCLRARGGRTLLNGTTLAAGASTRTFRSGRLDVTLGNNGVVLRANGKRRSVAPSSSPIGLRITPGGVSPLSAARRPTCAP